MKISELGLREAVTVTPTASVGDVARAMTEQHTPHVVVVDDNGSVRGVITARDLISKHAALHFPTYFGLLGYSLPIEYRRDQREIDQALATSAQQLMSTDVLTIAPDADVEDAATLMMDRNVSCLPVVQGGALTGVIDESDFVRLLVVEEQD